MFLALSLFYGWQIPDIPRLPVDALETMNARTMPWALALVGIVLSLALFAGGGPGCWNASSEEGRQSTTVAYQSVNVLAAVALLGWTALFANLLDWLGFFAATIAFLSGGFYLLGERRPAVLAGVTLATALVLYAVLRLGLGLYLPEGTLWSVFFGPENV